MNLFGLSFILIKWSIKWSVAAHWSSATILRNQKQLFPEVLQNRFSEIFCNIQRKAPVLKSLFNKVTALQLSCEYYKIFKNSFFHRTPLIVDSEKFRNFSGKHQWRKRNRFTFLINTAE